MEVTLAGCRNVPVERDKRGKVEKNLISALARPKEKAIENTSLQLHIAINGAQVAVL